MVKRLLNPLNSSSFFLFGARGTGKSTFIKEKYKDKDTLYLDLLEPELENELSLNPSRISQQIRSMKNKPKWVIIDEVQKVPAILNVVHSLIESDKIKFILTGSSARKLKRGAANMLAGRAFVYHLYPLTSKELNENFDLQETLRWGSLPRLLSLNSSREKKAYLNAYIQTYFADEIRAEQIVRKLDPFRAFLPILGQVSGKIINHRKISKEIGVSTATIQSYFQIVEDTLLGFYLPSFHLSVRKSQLMSPKFYLFDTGVKKALEQSLDQSVSKRTSVFGELFESFLINEIVRINSYCELDYRFSYLATKNNVEIDLILSKGKEHVAIEIKSSDRIDEDEVRSFSKIAKSIKGLKKCFYLSNDLNTEKIGEVTCMHWSKFLEEWGRSQTHT